MDTLAQSEGFLFQKRAAKKVVLRFCAAVGIGSLFVFVCNEGYLPKSALWSVFAAPPFVFCIAGTIESVTHRPYGDLAAVWKALALPKRLLLGVFLLAAALLALLFSVASLFHIWLIAHGNG